MKKLAYSLFLFTFAFQSLGAHEGAAEAEESFEALFRPTNTGKITVVNRILAKVNGTAISALDVQRKMDVIFYKQYPQYAEVPEARYQFYVGSWKYVLNDLINKELILADAKTMKAEVSSGDVRQELEDIFGPHMLANLERAGLTYEEAWTLTHDDIMLRRMMMARVNSKAIMKVSPKLVYDAYGNLSAEKAESGEWHYQVVTVRGDDEVVALAAATRAAQLLREGRCQLENVKDCLKLETSYKDSTTLSVSTDLKRKHSDISEQHRELVAPLEEGQIGEPLLQHSRADKKMVARFALLKEKIREEVPAFDEVATQLREKLIQEAIAKETQNYFDFLRKQFSVEDMLVEVGDAPPFLFVPISKRA